MHFNGFSLSFSHLDRSYEIRHSLFSFYSVSRFNGPMKIEIWAIEYGHFKWTNFSQFQIFRRSMWKTTRKKANFFSLLFLENDLSWNESELYSACAHTNFPFSIWKWFCGGGTIFRFHESTWRKFRWWEMIFSQWNCNRKKKFIV